MLHQVFSLCFSQIFSSFFCHSLNVCATITIQCNEISNFQHLICYVYYFQLKIGIQCLTNDHTLLFVYVLHSITFFFFLNKVVFNIVYNIVFNKLPSSFPVTKNQVVTVLIVVVGAALVTAVV